MKTPVAAALAGLSAALLALAGTVAAEGQRCEVPDYLLFGNNELKHVTEAVKKDRRLTIAVVGTGSSILAGPDGPLSAYPARLEEALKRRPPAGARQGRDPGRKRHNAGGLAAGNGQLLVRR